MTPYDKLNSELRDAGITDVEIFGEIHGPVIRLVNSNQSVKPFTPIITKYLGKLKRNETDIVVRALTEKGNKNAIPALLALLKSDENVDLWVVGNALYTIDDRNSYDVILEICQDKSLGMARQMLMGTLARMKTEEAYQVLIKSLFDPTIKGHAIEGLGRLGNIKAIEILEKLEVEKGKYEFKAKNTAIRRLKKKISNHHK